MDVLNIDEIIPPKRALQIGGVTYEMADVSVNDFVAMIREEKRQEIATEDDDEKTAQSAEKMLKIIQRRFPTLPADVVGRFTFPQINAILEWINAATEESGEKKAE
jgi:hypothetical protein